MDRYDFDYKLPIVNRIPRINGDERRIVTHSIICMKATLFHLKDASKILK